MTMIIRGQRILTQLNEFSTFDQLEDNITTKMPPTKKRQLAVGDVRVINIKYRPQESNSTLRIASATEGNGSTHVQGVVITGMEYVPVDTEGAIQIPGTDLSPVACIPFNLADHTVRVKCDCMDFYHRFAQYNAKDKSLVGSAPPAYQPTSNRPPVNPNRVPGVCKHLLSVFDTISAEGFVKD